MTFCPTRWTVRGNSIVNSFLENYQVLKQLWEECLDTRLEPDIKGQIIGVNRQISKCSLLFGLKLCERILKITDNLSMTLQTESLSAAEAKSIAADTIDTLKSIRSVEKFELFFQLVELLRVVKSQCFHKKGSHQSIFKMEMEKAIIALLLKNTIANSILKHWI